MLMINNKMKLTKMGREEAPGSGPRRRRHGVRQLPGRGGRPADQGEKREGNDREEKERKNVGKEKGIRGRRRPRAGR